MDKIINIYDLDTGSAAIDAPHGDTLIACATALARWQEQVGRLEASIAKLRAQGIYLDPDGKAVVPGWYERKKQDGQHVAWYLIWPHKHARRTGCKRRQYVRAAEVEATRARAERTREYRDLAARRKMLLTRIDRLGWDLANLAERHELATGTASQGNNQSPLSRMARNGD